MTGIGGSGCGLRSGLGDGGATCWARSRLCLTRLPRISRRAVGRRRRGSRPPCRCVASGGRAWLVGGRPNRPARVRAPRACSDRCRRASKVARSRRPAVFRGARRAPARPGPARGTRARRRPSGRARAPGRAPAIRRGPVRGTRTAAQRRGGTSVCELSAVATEERSNSTPRRGSSWATAPLRRNSAETSARSSASISPSAWIARRTSLASAGESRASMAAAVSASRLRMRIAALRRLAVRLFMLGLTFRFDPWRRPFVVPGSPANGMNGCTLCANLLCRSRI